MLDFIEPAQSKLLVRLVQWAWPLYAKIRYRGLRLEVEAEVIEAFRKAKGTAAVICANHSSAEDPDVLFGLSRLVSEKFYFLTAREVFGSNKTLATQWLQQLGCFSVERGLADVSAFKAIKDLLLKGAKIVIFPEGEISHNNEHLMKLENGPEQITLSALSELKSLDSKRTIFIMPLSMKYRYGRNITRRLEKTLTRLEKLLGRQCRAGESLRIRLNKAFDILLGKLEQQYHLNTDKSLHLGEQWRLLREGIIGECERLLKMRLPENMTQLRRIHILEIKLRQRQDKLGLVSRGLGFFQLTDRKTAAACKTQLTLATNLASIDEHSFDHPLTQEESAELISILELALCKRSTLNRPDIVTLAAGEVIDVNDFAPIYAKNRQEGVRALKSRLRDEVARALLTLEESQPRGKITKSAVAPKVKHCSARCLRIGPGNSLLGRIWQSRT